jgi:hypothetical protein
LATGAAYRGRDSSSYRPFEQYQTFTSRKIPVVVLEPAG